MQNILLGQTIYYLKTKPHKILLTEKSYILTPKHQNTLLELFYLINPSHFKMNNLQLYQALKKRFLQVGYTSYQEVKNQVLPKNINIIALEDKDEVSVTMEFKSMTLNEAARFRFKMPSGYKEFEIK